MPRLDYKEESRKSWGCNMPEGQTLPAEKIQLGAMLRIADATEVMAQNYVRMQNDLVMYKRWYKQECDRVKFLERSNAALRGHNKRLKKQHS